MSEDLTPEDRAKIRSYARRRAEAMGLRRRPEPGAEAEQTEVVLPTDNLFALRGLLATHRLTPDQERAARKKLADASRTEREAQPPTLNLPGDAA